MIQISRLGVNLWFSNEANAIATYGHIKDWNTSAVTDMTEHQKNVSEWTEPHLMRISADGTHHQLLRWKECLTVHHLLTNPLELGCIIGYFHGKYVK